LRELGKLEASDNFKTPQPKTKTTAKPIKTGVSGRQASSTDELEQALESNDTLAYIRAANKRDGIKTRWGRW